LVPVRGEQYDWLPFYITPNLSHLYQKRVDGRRAKLRNTLYMLMSHPLSDSSHPRIIRTNFHSTRQGANTQA